MSHLKSSHKAIQPTPKCTSNLVRRCVWIRAHFIIGDLDSIMWVQTAAKESQHHTSQGRATVMLASPPAGFVEKRSSATMQYSGIIPAQHLSRRVHAAGAQNQGHACSRTAGERARPLSGTHRPALGSEKTSSNPRPPPIAVCHSARSMWRNQSSEMIITEALGPRLRRKDRRYFGGIGLSASGSASHVTA